MEFHFFKSNSNLLLKLICDYGFICFYLKRQSKYEKMNSYPVEQLNELLKGELIGSTDHEITGPEELTKSEKNHISFIGNSKYENLWPAAKASVAVVGKNISIEPGGNRAFIKVDNVEVSMIELLNLFAPTYSQSGPDIHPSAIIDSTASVGEGTQIGAGSYIGKNVKLEKNVKIYPNVTILDECTIGDHTIIWSGAVVREACHIGQYCILHPNCNIGADGFGFTPSPNGMGLLKIPQIGNVILGNHVEIGAGACVDRGKFSSTILGDGCKIDNLVQIGHNCELGMFCIMAGNSGLAGSVKLGNGVVIGGSASIKDHTSIGDGATIGAGSGVTGDVEAGATYLGYPAHPARETLKQWAILKQLAQKK